MEVVEPPPAPLLTTEHAALKRDPYLQWPNAKLLAYMDVFVDDFLGLAHRPRHRRHHVHRTLFHVLDKVFRPLDRKDASQRKEVLILKKLDSGDCSWSTCQTMLGWIVDSVNMTITLPPHRVARLKKIVHVIPRTQRRVGVDKWHKTLGELRSMALALPRARGLCSQMQERLGHGKAKRVTLSAGVHDAWGQGDPLAFDVA